MQTKRAGIVRKAMAAAGSWLQRKSAGGVTFNTVDLDWYLQNGYSELYQLLSGGLPAWSGESVTLESALNHSVVWACNRIISESIGFIPAIMMKSSKDGDMTEAVGHPMFNAMKWAPNEEISAQGLTETMTAHCVLEGNAYAFITRRSSSGTALRLDLLHPRGVRPDRDSKKRLVYVVNRNNTTWNADGETAQTVMRSWEPDKTYTVLPGRPHDILHIRGLGWNGLRGFSVITMARQSIGSAIGAERNVARFWAHGGRKPYKLTLATKFKNDDDFDKFRADWERIYADPHKVPIEEPWFKVSSEDAMSMRDAQMIESRQFSIPEICRWFSVSPHLVGDLSRATFSNIEHLFLQFKQMTLESWINRWEQDWWRCVLTDEEKNQGYLLRHNVDELLRGDFKTRMLGYASALQNGHMNIDEVRHIEGRNRIPATDTDERPGSHFHIQLNMQEVGNELEAAVSDDEATQRAAEQSAAVSNNYEPFKQTMQLLRIA